MNDFTSTQLALHERAVEVLKELKRTQKSIRICSENLSVCSIDQRAHFQSLGDHATAVACDLQLKYYSIIKELISPIVFKENQESNVVNISEAFYNAKS